MMVEYGVWLLQIADLAHWFGKILHPGSRGPFQLYGREVVSKSTIGLASSTFAVEVYNNSACVATKEKYRYEMHVTVTMSLVRGQ